MSQTLFRTKVLETDDSGEQQVVRIFGPAGTELSRVHRPMPFGLVSHVPIGSHGVGISLSGEHELAVMLGGEDAGLRPRSQGVGETILYNAHGQAISLIKDNLRVVGGQLTTVKATKVVVDSGDVFLGSDTGAKRVKLEDGSNSTKVWAI